MSDNNLPNSTNERPAASRLLNVSNAAVQFVFPTTATSFSQRIRNHKKGTAFKGATIVNAPEFDMQKADQTFNALDQNAVIEEVKIPLTSSAVDIKTSVERFKLEDYKLPKNKELKYFTLVAVLIKYATLLPTYNEAVPARMYLEDRGMSGTHVNPEVSWTKTINAKIVLGLNHCIPISNIKDIQLVLATDATGVKKGRAWGSVEAVALVTLSSKGIVTGFTRSVVQYVLPSYLFEVESDDPRLFHGVLQQSDLESLRGIRGDVAGMKNLVLHTTGHTVAPTEPMFTDDMSLREGPNSTAIDDDDDASSIVMNDAELLFAFGRLEEQGMDMSSARRGLSTRLPNPVPTYTSGGGFRSTMLSHPEPIPAPGGARPLSSPPPFAGTLQQLVALYAPDTRGLSSIRAPRQIDDDARAIMLRGKTSVVYVKMATDGKQLSEVSTSPFSGGMALSLEAFLTLCEDLEFK